MNQILYTSNGKPSGPLPVQTIIRFFAFCIIALGVIFLVKSGYDLFAVEIANNNNMDNTVPQIEFAKDRKYSNYFSYS